MVFGKFRAFLSLTANTAQDGFAICKREMQLYARLETSGLQLELSVKADLTPGVEARVRRFLLCKAQAVREACCECMLLSAGGNGGVNKKTGRQVDRERG